MDQGIGWQKQNDKDLFESGRSISTSTIHMIRMMLWNEMSAENDFGLSLKTTETAYLFVWLYETQPSARGRREQL